MGTAKEASRPPEESKSAGVKHAYIRRVAAAKSGDEQFGKRRLQERFKIPEAQVISKRRNMLGFWKSIGPPCIVKDLGIGGISFFTHTANIKPGQGVHLTLQVPKKPALQLKGKVIHLTPTGPHSRVCGVVFTDYGASAWAILCDLYNQHADNQAGPAPKPSDEPIFD